MTMWKLPLAACLLFTVSFDASAQAVKIVGVGASSCQTYEAELAADPTAERSTSPGRKASSARSSFARRLAR